MVIIMITAWIIVSVMVAALLWWLLRPSCGRQQMAALASVLRTHGAQRWQAALALLRLLAMGASETRINSIWQELEAALYQALPDCPPQLVNDLAIALDDLHGCCRNRSLQKRIMDLRNAVLTG